MGHPVGEDIKLLVGECFLFIPHCDAVRRPLDLLRKNVCEDLILREFDSSPVELVHHLPEFRFIRQAETGNRLVGIT